MLQALGRCPSRCCLAAALAALAGRAPGVLAGGPAAMRCAQGLAWAGLAWACCCTWRDDLAAGASAPRTTQAWRIRREQRRQLSRRQVCPQAAAADGRGPASKPAPPPELAAEEGGASSDDSLESPENSLPSRCRLCGKAVVHNSAPVPDLLPRQGAARHAWRCLRSSLVLSRVPAQLQLCTSRQVYTGLGPISPRSAPPPLPPSP